MSEMIYMFGPLLVPILIVCAVIAVLTLIIRAGRRASKRGLRRGRIMVAAGAIPLLVMVFLVGGYLYWACPGHSKILTEGTSPSGQEYCVLQVHNGSLTEPYTVSFWIRDTNGVWRWNYLDHESLAWGSAVVTFSAEQAHVSSDGEPFRDIQMPGGIVDMAANPGHYKARELTAIELFNQLAGKTR